MRKAKRYNILIAVNLIEKMNEIQNNPPLIPGFTISRLQYLIHLILSHKQDNHPGSYSLLNSVYMRNVVPHADQYLRFLRDEYIIEWINHCAGRNSRMYRLKEEGKTEYRSLSDKKLINRIEQNRRNIGRQNSKKYPVLNSYIHKVQIDYTAALRTIDSEYERRSQTDQVKAERRRTFSLAEIERIRSGEIYIKCNMTNGRLDSNYTRLPGELIKHLTIDGKYLFELDIKNSQPFIAACLFNPTPGIEKIMSRYLGKSFTILSKSLQLDQYEDVKLYTSLVTSGKFYQFMMSKFTECDIEYVDMDDLKEQMFIVFFGKKGSAIYSKAAKLFRALFPHVCNLFELIKEGNHNKLSILLQRIESYTVLEKVSPKVVDVLPGLPFLTRHDSLLPSGILVIDDAEKVKKIMLEVIKEVMGLVPVIRVKNLPEKPENRPLLHFSSVLSNYLLSTILPISMLSGCL